MWVYMAMKLLTSLLKKTQHLVKGAQTKQKCGINEYFNKKWLNAWQSYGEARQTKIWFPQPNAKKTSNLLKLNRNNLSRLVQFLTGHNKLKRHKNIQEGVIDPNSCRLCFEDEESSFHVKVG